MQAARPVTPGASSQTSDAAPALARVPAARFDSVTMESASASAPTARERWALHILQAGAIAVVLAALPYKAFDLDRFFVPKELVLLVAASLASLLCLAGRRAIRLTVVDILLGDFLIVSLVSAILATNHWAAERAFAISLAGAGLFWAASALRRVGLVRPLLVALAFGVVLGAATSLAQAYGVESVYFSINRAPGGTFGNRNFVAHLVAIGLPALVLVALTARRGLGSIFGGCGMAIVTAALVLSRSRGAWLAVLVLAIPVGLLGYVTRDRWREARTVRRLIVLAAAAVVGVIAAIVLPNHLDWNSESPYLDSAAGLVNYKAGSGRGRLLQYANSLEMTRAHIVFGVGPGNWPVAYPKYASRSDPSMSQDDRVTSNPWPSSDWMAFLSERGVVGFAFLLLTMLGLLGRAVRDLRGRTGRDPERVLTAIALIGTLVALAVVGAFDAVLLIAVPTFYVWTLAGILSPPGPGGIRVHAGIEELGPAIVTGLAIVVIGRSVGQLSAMAVYDSSTRTASLSRAAMLDPGNYRIRTRLAQAYLARGDCTHARAEARAARGLLPNAGEPKRQLAECGSR